uniref:FYVE-type domain-containing protein n=1 Tax=Heterorhabditis bacteriophora TaxID=37862 RepID=A0A1I7XEK9_HETBA
MSKPPVAPKPKSVVDEKKNSNSLSTCLPTPAITVSSSDITDFVSQFVWNNPEDNISDAVEDQRRRPSNSESVRELARQFEESGLPFAALNTSSASSGSETDDERPSELRRDPGLDLLSPNKATVRRPSVGCFSGDPFMHEKIMDELKRQGVIRSSNHLFKHGVHVLEHSQEVDTLSISSTQHIPSDIGKLRDDKKVRTIGNLSIHIEEGSSSASTSRVESIASDRSSMLTSTDYETVIDYQTGDSEEYIYEFGKRLGKDLLNSQGTQQHVVRQLQHQIEQLIPVHQLLLDNFAAHLENWSSQSPDMADVIIKYADFLKICKPFLLEKTRFVQELTRLREENKDFDNATVAFEQKIFHRGVGAVVQQLDQVHQNFMSSVRERQQWEREINIARDEKRKYKRRMSEAIERQRRQSLVRSTVRFFKIKFYFLISRLTLFCFLQTPLVVQTTIREKVMSSTECHCNNDKCQCAQLKLIDSLSMNCDRSRCNSETNSLETVSQPGTPVDELPASSINSGIIQKKILLADTMKPLWIPDDSSTKCLMDGCDTVFSFLNRRHHCRDCGWLICSSCMGRAPLAKFDFKKEIVCPECYEKIESQCYVFEMHCYSFIKIDSFQYCLFVRYSFFHVLVSCRLFSFLTLYICYLLLHASIFLLLLLYKVKFQKFSIVEPQTLFLSPINRSLKRSNVRKRIALEDGLVFGKVFVKTPKGTELIRHAQLTDGMVLKFYKAAFDDDPCNQYVIYGFELREIELEQGGTQFELVHRNQIQTDRKEHLIIFRVEHEKSVKK